MKMTLSEYIVWKCDTLSDIKEQHPQWNDEQVMAFFRAVEASLKIDVVKEENTAEGNTDPKDDLIRRGDVLNALEKVFDDYRQMWDDKGGFAKAVPDAIRNIPCAK